MSTAMATKQSVVRSTRINTISCDQPLHLDRRDIRFHDVDGNKVHIELTIRNTGGMKTEETPVVIDAAPLGAFVTRKHLYTSSVPALFPGESHTIAFDATRPATAPLGDFSNVPPNKLLTALDFNEDSDDERQPGMRPSSLLQRLRGGRRRPATDSAGPLLPEDPLQLLGHRATHWAGNLNVFIGEHAVERHMVQALRIYPGVTNIAIFIVGDRPDAYQFCVKGVSREWQTELYCMGGCDSLLIDPVDDQPVRHTEWVPISACSVMILAVEPPEDCGEAGVDVHITQQSTGNKAMVEFNFDPAAAGPGCYVV